MWFRRLVMCAVCVVSLLVLAGSVWIFQTHRIRVPSTTKEPVTHGSQRAADVRVDNPPQSLPDPSTDPGADTPPTPGVDRPTARASTAPAGRSLEVRVLAPATREASAATSVVTHHHQAKARARHHKNAGHPRATATGHHPHHAHVTQHASQHGQRPPHSVGPAPGHVHHGGFATTSHHGSHAHGVGSNHHQSHSMHQEHRHH